MQPLDDKNDQNPDSSERNIGKNGVRKKISERLKTLPPWIVVTIIALMFLIILCLIPLLIIEVSNQWCNLFSGFFNDITPGICI
jgi:hypothetical protein